MQVPSMSKTDHIDLRGAVERVVEECRTPKLRMVTQWLDLHNAAFAMLTDAATLQPIRLATMEEAQASVRAGWNNPGSKRIKVDGVWCYVVVEA